MTDFLNTPFSEAENATLPSRGEASIGQFTLTPEQDAIVAAIQSGKDLIVEALAGCAKTSTIVAAANSISQDGIALAFNKRIADELKTKLPANISAMTMNSMGHRAWGQATGKRLNVDGRKPYRVVDAYLKSVNQSLTQDEKKLVIEALAKLRQAGAVPPGISRASSPIRPWDETLLSDLGDWLEEDLEPNTLLTITKCLEMSISEAFNGNIDFDDQIYMPVVFKGKFPQPQILFVDEAQDLNRINHEMIRLCNARQLVFVGDPNQAIYAFRGAMQNSMTNVAQGSAGKRDFAILPLTMTFRCGKLIVERQLAHVPLYKAAPNTPPGLIETFGPWSCLDIPDNSAVICRNNAPLMPVALALLSEGRKCTILGRDILASLKKDITKASSKDCPIDVLDAKLIQYFNTLAQAKPQLLDRLRDRKDAIMAATHGAQTRDEVLAKLDTLFSDTKSNITLCTGHKSKGFEWDTILHLDPHLIGARKNISDAEIVQENNLRYVIETRCREKLIIAFSDDLAEKDEN